MTITQTTVIFDRGMGINYMIPERWLWSDVWTNTRFTELGIVSLQPVIILLTETGGAILRIAANSFENYLLHNPGEEPQCLYWFDLLATAMLAFVGDYIDLCFPTFLISFISILIPTLQFLILFS